MTNDTSKTAKMKNGDNILVAYRQNADCFETIITIFITLLTIALTELGN